MTKTTYVCDFCGIEYPPDQLSHVTTQGISTVKEVKVYISKDICVTCKPQVDVQTFFVENPKPVVIKDKDGKDVTIPVGTNADVAVAADVIAEVKP